MPGVRAADNSSQTSRPTLLNGEYGRRSTGCGSLRPALGEVTHGSSGNQEWTTADERTTSVEPVMIAPKLIRLMTMVCDHDRVATVPGYQKAHELMAASEQELWAAFQRADQFRQMGDRGDVRENRLARFLKDQLPSRFSVVSGEVIDAAGNQSGQTDILIFDGANTRPLVTSGDVAIVPAEAVLATVEVKTKLTRVETARVVDGMLKLRTARPWDAPWAAARRGGSNADDRVPRIFTTLFAYDSDLVASNWPSSEMTRIRECASEAGLPVEYIDRLVVLSRGIVLPAAGGVYRPTNERGVLGLWFFQLMSFLSREVSRREAFPWDQYKLHESGSWTKVAAPLYNAPPAERATASKRSRARKRRNRQIKE